MLPDDVEAKNMYVQQYTGSLTYEHPFGYDSLNDHEDLKIGRD